MSVPAIALYASPPCGICSTTHQPCQISPHGSSDYDLNSRPSSSSASPTPMAPKPVVGGLSCLLSSTSVLHASSSLSFPAGDDLGTLRHDRSEEISCSYSYSPYSSSLKGREQSPVSVFQGPLSCGGSGTIGVGSSSRSPPSLKIPREFGEFRIGRDRLFSGFIRNALGSCLDYDIPSLPTADSESVPEELTFDMEDGSAEVEKCEPYAKEMLSNVQSRHKIFYEEFVVKAFYEAEKAHRGQMRASGDPYLQHCVETAVLLANVGANATVVAAGLLHDTFDDSFKTYDDIALSFGAGVADLVAVVSKLSQISKFARDNDTANKSTEADNMHTMILAMADTRAVLIKLADRLHNMMTLDALPLTKQRRFSKETLEIFAPLANRLGIFSWKEQLENLCFKHLYPEQHCELSSTLVETFDEAMIESAKEKLERALNIEGVSYHVLHGRHKSLYSIYSKMLKKNLSMNEIHDIHGLRLIVENEADCYKALDIVHRLWSKVEGKFKNYITDPKFNGYIVYMVFHREFVTTSTLTLSTECRYQSLHTVVLSENMVPLEVQIRTKEMHLQAEFGFAAHWRYKERDCTHPSFVLQMVEWARWVLTWHCETVNKERPSSVEETDSVRPPCSFPSHADDCPFSYKPQGNHDGPVFVVLLENEKMGIKELPAGSTLKVLFDKAGHGSPQHTPYSFPLKEELRPKLNNEPATDPDQKLQMGDVIELTPTIPDKSLTEYREEIQRMYNQGLAVSGRRR